MRRQIWVTGLLPVFFFAGGDSVVVNKIAIQMDPVWIQEVIQSGDKMIRCKNIDTINIQCPLIPSSNPEKR